MSISQRTIHTMGDVCKVGKDDSRHDIFSSSFPLIFRVDKGEVLEIFLVTRRMTSSFTFRPSDHPCFTHTVKNSQGEWRQEKKVRVIVEFWR